MHEEEDDHDRASGEPDDTSRDRGRSGPYGSADASHYAALMPEHTDAMLLGGVIMWAETPPAQNAAIGNGSVSVDGITVTVTGAYADATRTLVTYKVSATWSARRAR